MPCPIRLHRRAWREAEGGRDAPEWRIMPRGRHDAPLWRRGGGAGSGAGELAERRDLIEDGLGNGLFAGEQ